MKDNKSGLSLGRGSTIENCKLTLINSNISLGENVSIYGYNISLKNATLNIGNKSMLINSSNADSRNFLLIDNGSIEVGEFSKLMAKEIVVRFGGSLIIKNYTSINDGCEIRCDERIEIGSFNMISYECLIYDTNTHCILTPELRRKMTMEDYPHIGNEYTKPKTQPIMIKDDCWVGKRSTILRGVQIGDSAIIGTASVVTKNVPERTIWAGNPARYVKDVKFENLDS